MAETPDEGRDLRNRSARRALAMLVCGVAVAFPLRAAQTDAAANLQQAGERIYRDGLTRSGKPVRAVLPGGMPVPPGQAACINCHRRSGMGSVEGPIRVPPLIRTALSRPGWETPQSFGSNFRRTARRPAYDDISLARAIRDGIDVGGRAIAAPMPRYRLDDIDMASLTAYLNSLTAGGAPGVDEGEIHFATVLTDGVPAAKRRAMREVLHAYFDDRNAGSRTTSRQDASGEWIVKQRRQWRLHVWELTGSPESWIGQLQEHYRRQPVFAVLGGIASGPWQPVHDFCETSQLPCLFPSTDLPPAEIGAYSLYLSRGVALEAEALALYLRDNPTASPVLQVYGASGVAAADALRTALLRRGMPAPQDHRMDAIPDAAYWDGVLRGTPQASLVLWFDRPDIELLRPWINRLERVVVSSSLMGEPAPVPAGFGGKLTAIHPFVLPDRKEARLSRLRSWLRSKGMAMDEERVRADAYFAAFAATTALAGMGENFSRDHFVEQLENLPEHAATGSLYPRVSLGPGQRFAAKGAYVLTLAPGGMPTTGGWYVPE